MGLEVHFFPAVFFLAVDTRKSETLEGVPKHEIEGSIYLNDDVLAGL